MTIEELQQKLFQTFHINLGNFLPDWEKLDSNIKMLGEQ